MTRLTIAVLCLAGVAIAGYLSWVHLAELEPVCVGGGGACERVQSSPYAELAGVPVAVFGLAGYVTILASLAWTQSVTAFLALVGFGFSAYLTYLELVVIDAICQWCVASAAVMTAIAVASVARLVSADLRETPDGSGLTGPHTDTAMRIQADFKNDVARRPARPPVA